MSIYDFSAVSIDGDQVNLADYKGKALIVVNTASKCGFTPQYEELEKLYQTYKDQGLEILGFPSNQFAAQEPGSNEEVKSFCSLNYGVTFPLFEKTDVRGEETHPVFDYLIGQKPFEGFKPEFEKSAGLEGFIKENFPLLMEGDSIKWNFTKFLVNKDGQVVSRHEPVVSPLQMEAEIQELLK